MTAAHLSLKLCATNEATLTIMNAAPTAVRDFRAAVLRIAAAIEEATLATEKWLVHVERGEAWGPPGRETRSTRLWIECASGDEAELQRARAVLSAVASQEDAQ